MSSITGPSDGAGLAALEHPGVAEQEQQPVPDAGHRRDQAAHGLQRRALVEARVLHRLAERGQRVLDGRPDQLLPVGEVAVQGAAADAGGLGDLGQGGGTVAGQHGGGRAQDGPAGPVADTGPGRLWVAHDPRIDL